jgi:glycosyltransferase involved in cell wall biosynthesis
LTTTEENLELRISVIVPAYNAERYMVKCLTCLKKQTISPDEIIVVNDGSSDGTSRIAKSFRSVRVIDHPINKGIAAARNTGVKNSSGDIVAFLDSDCCAREDWLEKIRENYSRKDVGGVGGKGVETIQDSLADNFRTRYCHQDHGDTKGFKDTLWGLNFSFRRTVILKAGYFNEFFRTNGEDVEFSIRVRRMGYQLLYDPNMVVFHMKRDTPISILRTVNHSFKYGYLGQVMGGDQKATVRRVLGKARSIFGRYRRMFTEETSRGNIGTTVLSMLAMIAELLALRSAWVTIRDKDMHAFKRET